MLIEYDRSKFPRSSGAQCRVLLERNGMARENGSNFSRDFRDCHYGSCPTSVQCTAAIQ